MNITNAAILESLEILKAKYPHEPRISIWTEWHTKPSYMVSEPGFRFVAAIGVGGNNFACCEGETPERAVAQLISKAGDRDPQKQIQAQIQQAKAELAKLESQLQDDAAATEATKPEAK